MGGVRLLQLLERVGEMPAEVWLVPPVLILAAMTGVGLLRRTFGCARIARLRRGPG